jgi:hypothetical protein
MPADNTRIIRSLTKTEIHDFTEEIIGLPNGHWVKHYPIPDQLLRLRDGESVHINWPKNNSSMMIVERRNQVSKIWNFMCEFTDHNVGRAYIHRLKPGDKIDSHHDQIQIKKLSIANRFHIYLDIPEKSEIVFDNQTISDCKIFKNTLVDFSLGNLHSYKNLDEINWYFIVFDRIGVSNNA